MLEIFVSWECSVKTLFYQKMVILNRGNYRFSILQYLFLCLVWSNKTGAEYIGYPVTISKNESLWVPNTVDLWFRTNSNAFAQGIWRVLANFNWILILLLAHSTEQKDWGWQAQWNSVAIFQSVMCDSLQSYGLQHTRFLCQSTSIQFSSVTQSCPTLCYPMNCSMPDLPVHHQLPEFTQTHVHRVGDAIQPSHPRLSPSPPAPNPSQHQSLFQWVNSSHEVAKVPEFTSPGVISVKLAKQSIWPIKWVS